MFEENKNQFTPGALPEKDWLSEMLSQFDHPSTVLWRAVEARSVYHILSKFPLNSPVIDLGCGEGKFSSVVFDRGSMNVGLDILKDDVIKAKKKGVYKALLVCDGHDMPFREGSFSGVFSNSVIEHIPGVERVLFEISRILKEDGVFIFTVPSEQFGKYLFLHSLLQRVRLRKIADWYSRRRNKLLSHHNCYDPVTWKSKIENVGLNMIESSYYLSKSTVQVWDFLAICIFIMRRIGIFRTKLYSLLSRKSRKLRVAISKKILYKYYYQSCQIGGGLLIVAKKSKLLSDAASPLAIQC